MKGNLISIIANRLAADSDMLREQFQSSRDDVGVRYVSIDNLLPDELCKEIFSLFPSVDKMRFMSSFRERKYTSKNFDAFDPLLRDITFAIQDPLVVREVEKITGIPNQIPDPQLYAGGLSAMARDNYLGPHIDNSHDGDRRFYRTLNLLFYVTPDWCFENGGNLQLWNSDVKDCVSIHSKFNRLVLMETNPWSWHSVSRVTADAVRFCVSNYYFSPDSPTGHEYSNVTSFSALPNQRCLRALAKLDSWGRQALRTLLPQGLGKKDVYKSNTTDV